MVRFSSSNIEVIKVTEEEVIVDARGAFCPGPLMEAIKVIRKVPSGTKIIVLSTEDGSARDIPNWVKKSGHEVLEVTKEGDHWKIVIRKK